MRAISYTLLILALLATTGTAQDFPQRELFDSALAQYGLTVDDVRIDQDVVETYGGDKWRLSYFDLLYKNPFRIPAYTEALVAFLEANATNLSGLLARGSQLIDVPVNREALGDQLAEHTDFPDSLPTPSMTRSKNFMRQEEYAPIRARIDLLFHLIDNDDFTFKRGLKHVNKKKYRERLFDFFVNGNDEQLDLVYEIEEKIDFPRMFSGAQDIAEVVDRIVSGRDSLVFPEITRQFKTGEGVVIVGGTGDDVYELFEPPLLILEGGGNDRYEFSGYANDYPLTIIVDYGGNDEYVSTDSTLPGIGGAVLGMSVVADLDGDDRYEGVNLCQGGGVLGIGMMFDEVGNDVYEASSYSQGAAAFGVGIVSEGTGDDSLLCVTKSQGFGFTKGCGVLLSEKGNDQYVTPEHLYNRLKPEFLKLDPRSSYIGPEAISSEDDVMEWALSQGAGAGRTATEGDGHSWAGGIGVCADLRGNDHYTLSAKGQGFGEWYGLGVFSDGSGNDVAKASIYALGSGLDFGVGASVDTKGDDRFALNVYGLGSGKEYSIGYFFDREGSDYYESVHSSEGSGSNHSIAICHDLKGDDMFSDAHSGIAYYPASDNWKSCNGAYTFGIFIDGGGSDIYQDKSGYGGNDKFWFDTSNGEHTDSGIGIRGKFEDGLIGIGFDSGTD